MMEVPPPMISSDEMQIIPIWMREDVAPLVERINDKYLYWTEIKYQPLPHNLDHRQLWSCVKLSRYIKRIFVSQRYNITVSITNTMQRMCHEFDMNFGGSWGASSILPESNKEQYLISSLMEEAISSSKIEGASTTRKAAKEMLRKNVTPRDKSQQMIVNNYRTIRFIVENKDALLSSELLLRIHALMTENTMEHPEDAGRFRADNEVVVENALTHEVVHMPPPYTDIPLFIEELCQFFNDGKTREFIHPVIKGILIHFMLAYVHPFTDGNGRTARALFYWYMLKQGYWLTEYLSISRIIAKSKNSYEKAFQFVEADGNDTGYFVSYHLRVLELAFKDLQQYINRKITERNKASRFLRLGGFNERQASILQLMNNEPDLLLTVKEIQTRYQVTHTTAKADLDGLVKRDFLAEIQLNKVKKGYIKGDGFKNMDFTTS